MFTGCEGVISTTKGKFTVKHAHYYRMTVKPKNQSEDFVINALAKCNRISEEKIRFKGIYSPQTSWKENAYFDTDQCDVVSIIDINDIMDMLINFNEEEDLEILKIKKIINRKFYNKISEEVNNNN